MSKPVIFSGSNPSNMYLEALMKLVNEGDELAPKGKRIKELRPVILAFEAPERRVTFLKKRIINPFFQLAESWWIATGGTDAEWLSEYNKSILNFSDDGKFFNAPYGERLRAWGKNDARGYVYNPIDQLKDCYEKLLADNDTRQAVAFIGDPRFDNSSYTLAGGKDIACNINIKFKIRNGKLDITVDNRSNDLHWGTFGANLCQFSTIQSMMAAWLGIPVGTYYQITDSLHIYLDDFGASETGKLMTAYGLEEGDEILPDVEEHYFAGEPQMTASVEEFENISAFYWDVIDGRLRAPKEAFEEMAETTLKGIIQCPDEYLALTFTAMFVKQAHNKGLSEWVVKGMDAMAESSWKVSCLRFLYKSHKDTEGFSDLYRSLPEEIIEYIERKEV